MPLTDIRDRTTAAIAETLESELGHRPDDVFLEVPPRRELGDLAWPGALPLAKILRRSPRDIAENVAENTSWPDEVERVEVAGLGFLNCYLHRDVILMRSLSTDSTTRPGDAEKTIVEHTNINPNKAAHIGHLRNAVLGDILVSGACGTSATVEVQNYIDDTGVQVADVVVGLLYLPETELAEALGVETVSPRRAHRAGCSAPAAASVSRPLRPPTSTISAGSIYPRVTARYESDPEFAGHRPEVLHTVEAGHGDMELEQAASTAHGAVVAGEHYPPTGGGAARRRSGRGKPALPPGHHGAPRSGLRRAAPRVEHPPARLLAAGLRAAQGSPARSASRTRARTRAAG